MSDLETQAQIVHKINQMRDSQIGLNEWIKDMKQMEAKRNGLPDEEVTFNSVIALVIHLNWTENVNFVSCHRHSITVTRCEIRFNRQNHRSQHRRPNRQPVKHPINRLKVPNQMQRFQRTWKRPMNSKHVETTV